MQSIEEEIKPWAGNKRAIGQELFQVLDKHIRDVSTRCYKFFDPSTTVLPDDVVARERLSSDICVKAISTQNILRRRHRLSARLPRRSASHNFLVQAASIYAIEWSLVVLKETTWSPRKTRGLPAQHYRIDLHRYCHRGQSADQ